MWVTNMLGRSVLAGAFGSEAWRSRPSARQRRGGDPNWRPDRAREERAWLLIGGLHAVPFPENACALVDRAVEEVESKWAVDLQAHGVNPAWCQDRDRYDPVLFLDGICREKALRCSET